MNRTQILWCSAARARCQATWMAILFWALLQGTPAHAGLSPENVLVVVNAESYDSRTLANYYIHLRNIPSSNVVLLHDVPDGLTIPLDQFKSKILLPVLEQINARKLATQVKTIAYSAGFPTSVNISSHTDKLSDPNLKKYQLPTASLTGLTYYYQFVLADSEKYLDLGSNLYARGPFDRHFGNPFFDAERRGRFDEAIARRDAGELEPAADIFEQLFEGSRTIPSLAILAAEARAQAKDTDAATRLIQQAIAAGWASGTYLEESDTLSPLLNDPRVARLKPLLVDYPAIVQEPVAFQASVGWSGCGAPTASLQDGVPYLMSCMLAVVHPKGSTVAQAIKVMETAATSDSTFPDGAFWFTFTRDARTNPRFPQFGKALLWLKKAGYEAEIIHSAMPSDKTGPCVGLMFGVADFSLENQRWHFVPGAISENLTSFSARFDTDAQTKITTLLHAGAAMSCGPVYEPYNLPFKFPAPILYGYYGSGVSAIESFYLSITCPYQLLIVGDPMAQPFARSPTDWVGMTVKQGEAEKQRVEFTRRVLPLGERGAVAQRMELFVEGKLVRVTPAVNRIEMSLPASLSGAIEVRTVLLGGGPIQPRISHTEWLTLGENPTIPTATWLADLDAVQLRCEGASTIELMHHGESIGSVDRSEGSIAIDRQTLGAGPIRLRPVAVVDGTRVPGQALIVADDAAP